MKGRERERDGVFLMLISECPSGYFNEFILYFYKHPHGEEVEERKRRKKATKVTQLAFKA